MQLDVAASNSAVARQPGVPPLPRHHPAFNMERNYAELPPRFRTRELAVSLHSKMIEKALPPPIATLSLCRHSGRHLSIALSRTSAVTVATTLHRLAANWSTTCRRSQ
jgi:hypothetical protein